MYRCAIAFLLVNAYTGTFAIPLQPGITNGPLTSSLTALANHCKNSILTDQITNKLNDCNVTVPPYQEKQFNCLIFYDINIQLCDAVASSKLAVRSDQVARLNEEVDVVQLCDTANEWTVTNIPEYPQFKNTVERVFTNKMVCVKVCGVDDVTSQDSNFFCKYYKWGLEMLAQATSTASSQLSIDAVQGETSPNVAKVVLDDQKPVLPVSDQSVSNDNVPNSKDLSKATPTKSIKEDNDQEKSEKPSLPQGLSTVLNHIDNVGSLKADGNFDMKIQKNLEETEEAAVQKPIGDIASAVNSNPSNPNFDALDKPLAADIGQSKKETKEESPADQKMIPASESKPPVVKKQEGIEDEYNDSDEGKEGIDTQGGDDGDDPVLGDFNPKPDLEESKSSSKRIEAPVSSNNGEFFPNAFQEGFTDDDDHFFPFFLTAVIVVVILYILYHNKNKVSKVFLGLIVEGRQPGRRRNSRGHAYRRLDTLEQAMSTNSAAPPSKIIY